MTTSNSLRLLLLSCVLPLACFDPEANDDDANDSTGATTGASTSATTTNESAPAPDTSDSGTPDPNTTGEDPDTTASSGEQIDQTPPTVVSISPGDGEMGVWADTTIAVTFSEAMDRPSAQAAWQSANIGPVTFMWSADDTEMTVVPNAPLPYGTGSSPATTTALEYALTVDTTATDAAGNALEAPWNSSFFTLRQVLLEVPPVDIMTGMTSPSGVGLNTNDCYVGDIPGDTPQRGTMTFDFPPFPASFVAISTAVMSAAQVIVNGEPYGPAPGLGTVHILDVEYEDQFYVWDEAIVIADLGVFSNDTNIETKSFDVTEPVIADYELGTPNTQFWLQFPVLTNNNGTTDRVTFGKDTVVLELGYLMQ
ncbi:MAG: Ig-like domain-containing protein [Myxococcota bacterium]